MSLSDQFKVLSKDKMFLLILVILIPYLTMFLWNINTPQNLYMPDSNSYDILAKNLLDGNGYVDFYGDSELLRTPGYPLFMAFVYTIYGDPIFISLIQIFLTLAAGIMIYNITTFLGYGEKAGLAAMGLYCLNGIVFVHTLFLLAEALFVFIITTAFYLLLKYQKKPNIRLLGITGLLLGLSALVRPIAVYFIAVIILLLLYYSKDRITTLKHAVVFLTLFIIVLSPWLARNYAETGKVMFSTSGPLTVVYDVAPVYGEINGIENVDDAIAVYLSEVGDYYGWEKNITRVWLEDGLIREPLWRIDQVMDYNVNYILTHPIVYLKHHLWGNVRTWLPTSVNEFSYLVEGDNKYGLTVEIAKNLTNFGYIRDNLLYVLFKFFELLIPFGSYVLSLIGLKYLIKDKKKHFFVALVLLWILYNISIASVMSYDRLSIPLVAFTVVFAGVAYDKINWGKLSRFMP
jgi:hypothetical protein